MNTKVDEDQHVFFLLLSTLLNNLKSFSPFLGCEAEVDPLIDIDACLHQQALGSS